LVALFGQWRDVGVYRGIQIASTESEIRPIDEGEVVFFHSEAEKLLPYPLGSFVILQHGKTVRSLYAHIDINKEIKEGKTYFRKDESIGNASLSGAAETQGMALFIYDIEAKQYVNPKLLLPAVRDTIRPTIRNVRIESKVKSISLPVASGEGVPKGEWEVVGEIFDQSMAFSTFWPMAVYKVNLYINGKEQFSLTLDAIKEKEGNIYMYPSKGVTLKDLYKENQTMRLGTVVLIPGVVNLEIVARDFAGNERIQTYRFQVE
ncbi:MAG: hypothetical protein SNJ78_11330, partial [Spirochaetales bacterium]